MSDAIIAYVRVIPVKIVKAMSTLFDENMARMGDLLGTRTGVEFLHETGICP